MVSSFDIKSLISTYNFLFPCHGNKRGRKEKYKCKYRFKIKELTNSEIQTKKYSVKVSFQQVVIFNRIPRILKSTRKWVFKRKDDPKKFFF